ncbi:hypothetical protein [Rubinisphaera margarita]|uniref:hypothetical protein n=1 Tax=Rubinisphaera margarita TaxID=2909586 RepID=UPI001EE98827|nr:hypothetical protein [Rubinisphaera margarita]MCG6158474.1 hypothetical protein [Rubinisphaera margarita]
MHHVVYPRTSGYRVAGKRLIVQDGAVLPPLCIRLGVPVERGEMHTVRINWHPWLNFAFLLSTVAMVVNLALMQPIPAMMMGAISLLPATAIALASNRTLTLTFGMDREKFELFETRKRVLLGTLFVLLTWFGTGLCWNFNLVVFMQCVGIVQLLVLFLRYYRSPLWVVKHRRGEFTLIGCSRLFLEEIKPEPLINSQPALS